MVTVDSNTRQNNTAANTGLPQWRLTNNLKVSAFYYLCCVGQFRSGKSATAGKPETVSHKFQNQNRHNKPDNFSFDNKLKLIDNEKPSRLDSGGNLDSVATF